MAVSTNGMVWTASDDKTIRVINASTFKFVKKLRGHMGNFAQFPFLLFIDYCFLILDYVSCLTVVGNRVWSGSEDRSVGVWDCKTFRFVKRLQHDRGVKAIASVSDRICLTGSADGSVRVLFIRM